MKAIETHYKGYHFRSRLEARWAVFFDALGLAWEYEAEGYVFNDGERYLPDFKILPSNYNEDGYFIEIKPVIPTKEEGLMAAKLALFSGKHVDVLFGQPGMHSMLGFNPKRMPRSESEYVKSAIAAGDYYVAKAIIEGMPYCYWLPEKITLSKLYLRPGVFANADKITEYAGMAVRDIAICPGCLSMGIAYSNLRCDVFQDGIQIWKDRSMPDWDFCGYCLCRPHDLCELVIQHELLTKAYNAAKSARFEFGQQG